MTTISVNTTSTNFGLLPADAASYATWLSQYSSSSVTIYQDQNQVFSNLLSISDNYGAYINAYGYNSLTFISPGELQLIAGPYTVDYYGTFSSTYSSVSRVFLSDSANGTSAAEFGTFNFAGYPVISPFEIGSTITGANALVPDPASPSTNLIAGAVLNTTWNGTYWNGTTTGYYETISDSVSKTQIQIDLLEAPSPVSFQDAAGSNPGYLNFPAPNVDGVGVTVSNYTTGLQTDSVLISGFSYSANSVTAPLATQAAIQGNDTVTITGAGSLDVLTLLANDAAGLSSVTLHDSAANVQANLGALETLAVDGKLASISLTDSGTPAISVTSAVAVADARALAAIITPFDKVVLPCFAAGTRIATERGPVAVEHLQPGDCVLLAEGGSAPIVWLGHRRVDCHRHPRPSDVRPVRITAHAFGLSRPLRDVLLSPDHAVFVDGALIPVRYLLNDATVRQEDTASVTYWHVELPAHGVLLADGLPAESYLDTGNRASFIEGGTVATAHPAFARSVWQRQGCAPLVTEGPVRDAVYRRLLVQAMALGWETEDAENQGLTWRRRSAKA